MTSSAWIENLLVIAGFALVAWIVISGARSERWKRAWLRLRRDRIGMVAGCVIILYLLIGGMEMIRVPIGGGKSNSVLGFLSSGVSIEDGYSAPFARTTFSLSNPTPLRGTHIMGTDALGKDVFVQALRACRTALVIGGMTSLVYIPLGTLLGIAAGYFRKWVDDIIQYLYTVVYSIPEILFLISMLIVLGKGLGNMAFALGMTYWVSLCRLIRGETMRQAERPYVAAARALGQSHWKIITRHLLPNVMHLVLIKLVLGFSSLVLAEALLSYLGVGSPIGTPSWGSMIDGARGELSREPVVWWNLTAATGALFVLVLSLNLFGDALRRAFDPKRS